MYDPKAEALWQAYLEQEELKREYEEMQENPIKIHYYLKNDDDTSEEKTLKQ